MNLSAWHSVTRSRFVDTAPVLPAPVGFKPCNPISSNRSVRLHIQRIQQLEKDTMSQEKPTSKPSHNLVAVLEREGKDPIYQPFGVAFTNEKGTIIPDRRIWPVDPSVTVLIVPVKDKE